MTGFVRMACRHAGAIALTAMALLSCAGAQAAEGDDTSMGDGVLNAKLAGFAIRLPVPEWFVDDGTPLRDQARLTVRQAGPGISEMIVNRPDEDAISWTSALGVVAINRPGYSAGLQFRAIAEPLGASCMPGKFDFSWIVPLPGTDREALVGLCGRYNIRSQAANSCAGGIIAAVAVEKPEGVVSAYYKWCTGSFDVSDAAKWPVPRAEIEAHARALQKMTDFEPVAD